MPTPKVGQVWRPIDWRDDHMRKEILRLDGAYAYCTSYDSRTGTEFSRPRILRRRLNEDYALVKDVSEAQATENTLSSTIKDLHRHIGDMLDNAADAEIAFENLRDELITAQHALSSAMAQAADLEECLPL